jgi:hypothetical protein
VNDQEHPADPGHGPGYAGGPSPAGPGPAEHPAGPGPAGPPGDTPTVPARPARAYRAESFRGVIFGRGAGWAVAAVLAGAVVALSILLADGTGGPQANFVVGPAAGAVHQGRLFVPGRQAISVPPGALMRPGVQILSPGFAQAGAPLSEQCLRLALPSSGQGSASPAPSPPPTATPRPSASPGQSRITIRLPGGHSATCIVTVKPG